MDQEMYEADREKWEKAGLKSSIPDFEHVVHQVRNSRTWNFTTKEGLCEYSNAVVVALNEADDNFGHLKKSEGQNHCVDPEGRNCAVDVALWLATGAVVDFIVSAGYGVPPPPNDVCWQPGHDGEYPSSSWFPPVADGSGGGNVPDGGGDIVDNAQLDRIEAKVDALSQDMTQVKLFMSNMNEQIALQGGVVNKLYAENVLEGPMVRQGDNLTLQRK